MTVQIYYENALKLNSYKVNALHNNENKIVFEGNNVFQYKCYHIIKNQLI